MSKPANMQWDSPTRPHLDHVPVEPEYTARPISLSLIMAAFFAGIVGLIAALLAGPAL